jgi:hypothetical protein
LLTDLGDPACQSAGEAVTMSEMLILVNAHLRKEMVLILFIVIGLVAWALHLMQQAMENHEFSLMLAGFLVSSAAAALVGVYFLMGHYVGYMNDMAQRSYLSEDLSGWTVSVEPYPNWSDNSPQIAQN